MLRDAPATYAGVANFPLREGLDALVIALEQSTTRASPRIGSTRSWLPSTEELNSLVKAQFIYECLVESHGYRNAGNDSPWAFALANILGRLEKELGKWRQEIDEGVQVIAALSPEFFHIWAAPEVSTVTVATESDVTQGEEKVLEVPLVSSAEHVSKTLIVFRRPRNEFRVLTFISSSHSSTADGSSHGDPKIMNIHSVNVVARYAIPANPRAALNMEICFPGASSGYTYSFKTRDDLKKFQHALTGYKIVFEDFCRWKVHCSGFIRSGKLKGEGFVQILQPKQLPALTAANETPALGSDADQASMSITRADSILSDRISIAPSLGASSLAPSTFVKETKNSFIAAHPQSPVLLILTEIDGQPTFIHVRCGYPFRRPVSCSRTLILR